MKSILGLLLVLSIAKPAYSQAVKAFDGLTAYCNESDNLVRYEKFLKMEVVEQNLSEDTAEASLKLSLVEEACAGSPLDVTLNIAGSLVIEKLTLTVTTQEGHLLFQSELKDLLKSSIEEVTFGVPRIYADSKTTLEIGVQIFGNDSQNVEMLNPVNSRFGLSNFKFKTK